jgi:hypothetical protein
MHQYTVRVICGEAHHDIREPGGLQVISTDESRSLPNAPSFMRAINAIQLLWRDGRRWIVSVAWQHEAPHERIPVGYLAHSDLASDLRHP